MDSLRPAGPVLFLLALLSSATVAQAVPAQVVEPGGMIVSDREAQHPLAFAAIAQQAYLKASNTDATDKFGQLLAASGDTVVVGTLREDSNATGVNGDETDNSTVFAGAVYVFVRNGATWSQQAYLKASNTGSFDNFGFALALSGATLVASAPEEDSGSTGVDGPQGDDGVMGAGAAYVFDLDSPWGDLGHALAGTSGEPRLTGSGTLVGGEPMEIRLGNALPSAPAFLFLGIAALDFTPFYGGTLVPDFIAPPGQIVVVTTNGHGGVTLGANWPASLPVGFEVYLQYWIADAGGPFGFSASNGLLAVTH